MIFDSPQMAKLRRKYADKPDHLSPWMAFIDRAPHFAHEREYLEAAIVSFPNEKQRKLVPDLCDDSHGKWRGAWFELMLYQWLTPLGAVECEPSVQGRHPDFSIELSGLRPYIEAKAITGPKADEQRRRREYDLLHHLREIERPVRLSAKVVACGVNPPRWGHFRSAVLNWIDSDLQPEFSYSDGSGNAVRLEKLGASRTDHVQVLLLGDDFVSIPNRLHGPLLEKIHQHLTLAAAGHPYVIALFLESSRFAAQSVVDAWLGRETLIVDRATGEPLLNTVDRSGIRSIRGAKSFRAVSGLLVFKNQPDPEVSPPSLRSWYIQNPFATLPLPPGLFPVEGEFVILSTSGNFHEMAWRQPAIPDHYLEPAIP